MQFILDDNGTTFSTGALSFNDVPQTHLITTALIETAFDKYSKGHPEKENVEVASENGTQNSINTENGKQENTWVEQQDTDGGMTGYADDSQSEAYDVGAFNRVIDTQQVKSILLRTENGIETVNIK